MEEEAAALLALAKENPWRMFNGRELALVCNVSETTLNAVRAQRDNPFSAGKCRPETLIRWFARNPGWQPSKQ